MPNQSRYVAAAVAAGLCLAIGSCGNPTAPPGMPGPGPSMTTVRIEIVAPPSIEPGATVQLTANGTQADGSIQNISNSVQWFSDNPSIVQVSATGLATGKMRGQTRVRADDDNHQWWRVRSNSTSTGRASSLSGPAIDKLRTFEGSGTRIVTTLSFGYFVRF